MRNKINVKRKILYIFLFILSLASLVSFLFFKHHIYPEININLDIDRKGANQKSIEFLERQGIDVAKYKNVTNFYSNDSRANFLEKNLSAKDAGILMDDEINVWGFQTRFFIPLEQEEYRVYYDNKARFSVYLHRIPEGEEGAILEPEEAKLIAETFIVNNYYEDLEEYTLVESNVINREKRRDYSFTWEHNNFDINGAKKRIVVSVSGDQIDYFNVYLKIPEEWIREEVATYSKNGTTQKVAEAFTVIFIYLPMIFLFVFLFKKRKLQRRFALIVGIITFLIGIFLVINSLPIAYFKYSTLESWLSFLAGEIFGSIVSPIFIGVSTFLTVLVSEAYFRVKNPELPALNNIFTRNFVRNKKYLRAITVGFLVGFILLAYQMFYYYFALKIGYWVPTEVVVGGKYFGLIPWIIVLSVGFLPAILEEIVFRLFGVTFFKKIFKKTWAAILLSSILWAFLHSAYPQQPFFARGLELLPVGIVLSYLYLKFGIISSITAHFTMNSFLALQVLLKTNLTEALLSSFVFFLPLILIIIIYINTRLKGESTEILTNLEITEKAVKNKEKIIKKELVSFNFNLLKQKARYLFIIFGIIGLLSFVYMGFNQNESIFEKPLEIRKRSEIIKKSDDLFQGKGYEARNYNKDVSFYDNFYEEDYLLDLPSPKEKLQAIYRKEIPESLWSVKYFKPEEKEKFIFTFLNNGELYDYNHIMAESAEGKSLNQEEALGLAEENLRQRKDIIFSDYEIDDISESKKENRMDFTFVYKNKYVDLGKGSLNILINVRGDEVVGFDKYIDIPESWIRNKMKSDFRDFVLGVMGFVIAIFLVVYAIYVFLKMNRNKKIKIKKYYKYSFIPISISTILYVNSLSRFYSGYNGIESIKLYILKEILLFLVKLLFSFILISLLYSFAVALFNKYINKNFIPQDKEVREKAILDAILIGYGVSFFSYFLSLIFLKIRDLFLVKYGLFKYLFDLPKVPLYLNDYIPLLTKVFDNIYGYLVFVPALFVAVLILYKILKKWKFVWIFILFYGILGIILGNKDINAIVLYLTIFIIIMMFVLPLFYLMRKNYLLLFVFIYVMELTSYFSFSDLNLVLWVKNIVITLMLFLPIILYKLYSKGIILRKT